MTRAADPASTTSPLEAPPSVPGRAEGSTLPERLGAYRVLRRLAEGGMGVVYVGHDDVLDRPVALKVLPASSRLDPAARARIEREARLLAQVVHPNVVAVYASGDESDVSYFVMELVRGPDLREVLEREGPLPFERAARYLRQAALGLGAAHRRGLVHRDVKPGNLLLDRDADAVKVADFGITARTSVDASLSGSSLVEGTPLYVAPEVVRDGEGDHRSDMYSLGATFHHLLAGAPPFEGKTPAAVLLGHATQAPRELGAIRPGIPPALAALVRKLLEKDPSRRYSSWDDVALAASRALDAPPPPAAPPPLPARVAPPRPQPRRGRKLPFVALLLCVLAGFLTTRSLLLKARRHAAPSPTWSTTGVADIEEGPVGLLELDPEDEGGEVAACASEDAFVASAARRAPWRGDLLFPLGVADASSRFRRGFRNPFDGVPDVCPSGGRYAVLGSASSGGAVVAWHLHSSRWREGRVVLSLADGRTASVGLASFLGTLRKHASARGVRWEEVEQRLEPFLR